MELWIRSQDKQILKQAYELDIYDIFEEGLGCFYFIEESGTTLGQYKTKERALEVLEEIQNILKPQIILRKGKITGCVDDTIFREPDGYDIKELSTYVYEMPKE